MNRPSPELPISVIVPARNAAHWLADCLASINAQHPAEIIVVDGCSTDATVEIARAAGALVLSDGGRGVPAARMMGARAASCEVLALIDADVLVPSGALESLLAEFTDGHYDGLQFALASHSDSADYWGQALAWHHNHSRVREWFCVCATLMRRELLLEFGFDERFRSGEDIELRVRLQEAGARLGVSRKTTVAHRFSGGFETARDQWVQDGAGLARTAAKHPSRAGWVVALPLLAAVRGVGLSIVHAPRYLPYWAGFLGYNYQSMFSEWLRGTRVAP